VKRTVFRRQLVCGLALACLVGRVTFGERAIASTQDSWEENDSAAAGGQGGGSGETGGGEPANGSDGSSANEPAASGDSAPSSPPSGASDNGASPPSDTAAQPGADAVEPPGGTEQPPSPPAPVANEGGQEPQQNAGPQPAEEPPPKRADLKDRPFDELTADDFKDAKLGDKLGSGGNKDVFVAADRDDIAIGVLKPGKSASSLDEEIELLDRLKEQGLPTADVLGTTTVDGRPAIVLRRFAEGSKTVVKLDKGKIKIVGNSTLLNQKSVEDLQRIRAMLVEKNLKVDDLQFLIAKDGSVVIADPLEVHLDTEPSKNNLRMIDLLIQVAQRNSAAQT